MSYLSNNLTALAIIPGLLILIYVYSKDKVEKEPLSLIVKLIFLGVISCLIAGFAESFTETFLPKYPGGSLPNALINSFVLAGFWEELLKYIMLRKGSWNSKYFNYRFDAIVYSVSVAVGFAIFENIMYVSQYGLETAVVRAFTAVPLHAFCGITMGVFYAYEKKSFIYGQKFTSLKFKLLAFLIPLAVHGTYDTFAFLRTYYATYMLLAFVIVLYIIAVKTIKSLSAADRYSGFYSSVRYM